MAKQYKVLVNNGKADNNKVLDIQQGLGDRGQPVRIKAQAGAKYELQEAGRKKPVGPDYIKAKRVGNDLHILFENENEASLIIEGYYSEMAPGYNGVIGQAENGSFYEYIPEDPRVPGLIPELVEGGQAVNVALGGAEVNPVGAVVAFAAFPLLGTLGLLGAGAAAAYYANKNDSNGTTGGDLSNASDSGSSNSDNITKQNSNLVINGKGAPNSSVDVVIKDANGNTVYSGKASTDANGNYSYSVPGPLPDGKYTPFMNGAQGEPFTIDTSTRIDMTNAGKAGTSDPISGTAEPGASVVVKDPNGNVIGTTTADASGNWSIKPSSPVPAGEIRAEATDAAGNTASDPGSNSNNASLKTALSIDPIATDNVLTLAEQGAASYTVTGKVTGKFGAGDVVSLALNGKTYAAVVAADGSYSVPVAMSDLKADPDTKIEGSISPTGGDKATAAQDYTLEAGNTVSQTALSINPVTSDNIITAAENTGSIAITGKVTGKFAAGDVVTLTVNNKTFSGAAAADGSYSINVPAADLTADSDTQIDGSVSGSGGTLAKAIQDYGFDAGNTTPPTPAPSAKTALHLEPITANLDNILSQSEGASTTITVGGFASGTFAEGDMVSLVLNGRTYTALVDNNGNYSVSILSADLKADADKTIEASITGTGGSAATAAQTYQVETASNTGKITALSIDPVTSDNMLGSSETTGNIPVNGYVSGTFSVNDTVTLTINGKTFTGKPDSSGFFSINVPATDLAADADTKVEGTVTGTGGTTARAVQDYGVDSNNNRNLDPNPSGDTTPPTIEVERLGSGTLTSSETIRFKLSEASTTFNQTDVTVTGGTLSQFTPVPTSGTAGTGYKEYTATFTPTANANGTATIGVAAGKFTDNAGNQNLDTFSGAAGTVTGQVVETNNLVSIAYNTLASPNPPADTTAPSIIVARAGSASLASGNTELITFTLSENSSTFTLADIDVSGGTLSGFAPVPGSGTAAGGYHQYTAVFTPAANSVGTATIGVAAGQFTDAASNANTDTYVSGAAGYQANNLVAIGYNTQQSDTTQPSIEVSRAGSGTVTANETIYFTLSEASTAFTQGDIDVTGGTLSNFAPVSTSGSASAGFTQYTATFTPTAGSSGKATIGVVSGKFTDASGNSNADTYVSPAPAGATTEANNQISLSYNTGTSPATPDTTAPTIAITADKATLVAGQTAQLSFVLSEISSDFVQGDVQVSGGTLSNWVQVSPTQYSATFTPTAGAQGTGSVYVASSAFRDAALNPNADGADANNTVNFITNHGNSSADTTAPTIAIARMGSGTLTSSETITFTLSEASTTFNQADVTVTGGTLSNFTPVPTSGTAGSGYTHYTATFTPTSGSTGTATIGVAAGKFSDNAGNQNLDTFSGASGTVTGQVVEANNLVTIAYNTQANPNPPADTTAPTIVVERATTSSLATGNTELITFTLSENSSNFTLTDIDVSGGSLLGLAPVPSSGTTASGYHQYTAVFTPAANSVGTATIGVAASKFSDAAGNANQDDYRLAGTENLNNQVVIAYNTRVADTTAPTIEVARGGSGTVTGNETIYFTLSEASATFTQGDIEVTGGTLSNFAPLPSSGTASGGYTQYTATFTPNAGSTGTATIGVVSGKFTDAAGNNNQDTYLSPAPAGATTEANNQVSLNYNTSTNPTPPADTTAPTIAISADKATLAAGQSATVSFVLSEPSSDFIQTDVQVTGGTLSNWTQINASTYTATYTAAAGAQGTGRISVASNAFRDAANNFNADGADANNAVDFITNYGNNGGDTTPPTIVLTRTSSGTLTSSETLTFTLSEAATNFVASDIDVTGGTLGNFSPVPTSGTPGTGYTQYTATFTPTANASGSATIGVAAGQFTDNAGNANQDDYRLAGSENTNNLVTIAYNTQANPNPPADSTAPSIVVARAGTGSLTSGGTDTITFTLSENASTFNLADIDVVGGALSNFAPVTSSGSASTGYHQYTATFTPTANASGSATIGVAAGKFSDAAGNANQDTYVSGAAGYQANNLVTIGYNTTQPDTTAPTIEVTRAGSGTVGSTGETIYFTLSEASTTFTLADIDVTGGTVSNLVPVASSASGTGYKQYTATFTPSAGSAGTATIGVASGKFTDLSGNANTDTYVSPAPAGAALEANNQVSLSYNTQTNPATPDTTAPSVAVTIDKTVLSAGQSAVVTFTLSEASTTFAQSDVDVTGGALSGWTQISASVYTATFTPTANTAGTATIGVKSGTFGDTAGNLNADTYLSPAPAGASTESNNQVSLSYNAIPADTTAPSIIVSRTNAGTTLAAGANETISFKLSEASLDFEISDVVVTGGTLSNFTPVPTSGTPGTGYTEYTASFTPSANSAGTATIGVAAGRFSDNAGNKNTDTYVSGAGFEADNQVSLAYNTVPPDTTAPKIALTRKGSGSLVGGGSDEITFVLSESSTSFTLADIDVVGGTLTNFAPVLSSGDATRGYTDYTATFTPTANSSGLARIGVQSGKFNDTAGNANLDTYLSGVSGTTVEANNVIDITYNTTTPDTTPPSIVVSRAGAGMVSTSETIYFTLSEASTTFTQSDIDVQGGTLSGFAPVTTSGDATNGYTQYTATFSPTANSSGVATVGVKSATFSDMAGNANADTYMSPAPSGATFETNNQVSLNFNTLVPDTTSPTIAIDRSGTGVVTGAETITFTLTEASTNFIASDIDVAGGTLNGFSPVLSSGNATSGYTQYTATFTPTAGTVGSAWVAVASGKFTDAASNTNLDTYLANVSGTTQEANNTVEFSVNTDTTAPSVAIARANGQTTQTFTGAETITFSLSEDSSDFSAGDVVVTGGTLSNFSGSGRAYSATFTPTANASGTVTIGVAAGTFRDAAGNQNLDTYSGSTDTISGRVVEPNNLITAPFNTDSTAPTVIVTRTGGASGTVTGAESITFTFSEAINPSSFVSTDIDAVGGAISNLLPDLSSGTAATGYTRYSATFTPTAGTSGTGSVGILATKFTDVAGNPNADSYALTGAENANNQVSFAINTSAPDTTPPTIAITRAGAGTVTGAETIYFTLSEASTDFAQADIDVSGGSLSNFQQSSTNPLVYSATFTPAANSTATATIGVAAGKFKDAANNLNLDTYSGAPTAVSGQVVEGNNQLSLNVNTDTTAPTIVVGRQGTGTVTGPITVTFTLSEASTDFALSDIDAVGGTVTNLQGSGTSYTATFTPNANAVGSASVGVTSSKFSDAGGNFNKDTYLTGVADTTSEGANTPGANIVVFQFSTDTTAPTIALSRTGAAGATFTGPETITFTLSEASTDFVWNGSSGDIVVNGGTLSALTQSSTNPLVYTATFTPTANASGTASISVASNQFSDSGGNFNQDGADANNTLSAPFNTVPADTTAPTVIVSRANGNTTQSFTGAETIAFTFSEAVSTTSFVSGDIDAVGGTLSNLLPDTSTGSASTGYTRYTATFTPTTAGTVSVGVDASRFADAAGNSNIDTYRSGISGTTQEANNQVSATYVPPATNATATIDILGMSTDAGTSASDFRTNDQTLSFNGSITNWISTNGDRVMLEVYDADPTSGTFGQLLTTGFATPAANGTWTWDNTSVTRAAGLYTLKATIVSATGTTALNSTAPINGTGGGHDQQVVVIDTAAANSDVTLALSIRTDADNNTWVNGNEIGSSSTFTSRATFANGVGSSVRVGDKITFNATNDGTALTPVTVTLTSTDITNGYVETTFAKPADGKVQNVTASYTDLAGNAAAGTVSDSATLDTTTPTIIVARSGSGTMIGAETITFTLSEASTDFAWDAANQTGDIVVSGGTLGALSTTDNITYTATFTPTANSSGTASIGLAAGKFKDAAGNFNLDTYDANDTYTGKVVQADNRVSATFNTVLPTTTITQINGDGAPLAAPTLTITDSTTGTAANSATTTFTFTFSQAVKGFAATDVTVTDGNGGVLSLTPTGTWADGQTVYTGTVTAPASGAGAYAVTVADGSYQSNSGNVPGYGNSNVQAYATSQDGFSRTATTTSGGNGDVGVSIALSNGNYIWSTSMGNGGLDNVGKAQIFNSSGGLITSSLSVPTGFLSPAAAGNVSTTYYVGSNYTSYAALAGGGFVVAYTDDSAGNNYSASIWVVKYDNNGAMISSTTQRDTAVVSNAYGSGLPFSYTGITPTANGNYILTYARATTAGSGTNAAIYAVEIDGSTNAIVAGRTPSLISASSFGVPSLRGMDATTLVDGKIVVSWAQGGSSGVYTRVLNADGTPLAGSNVLQSLSTATQHDTINTIATPDGGFVIVSTDQTVANNAGNGVIKAIKYTVSGNTVTPGTVTTVSTANVTGTDNNKNPAAAVLTNGNIVITWENEKAVSGAFYRIYDANLNPISPARNIPGTALNGSTSEGFTLSHTVVTALPDGGFVIGVSGSGTSPTGVNTQQVFFSADGTAISKTGSTASDTQIGGDGADTLTGGGGADVILAGAGNDTVIINASNISNLTTAGRLLDGGTGIDTLRMGANASTLDLSKSAIQANVQNFEKIDLGSDAVVNTVILNATAVQRLATQNLDGTSSNKQLIIDGTSSDLVKLSGQWNNGIQAGYWQQSSTTPTRTVGGVTYKVYTISGLSGVEVLVNNAITTANTDLAYQMASGDIVTVPSNSAIVGDLETTATGGSTGTGDGGSQQPLTTSSTTSDTSPLVQGTLSQALSGTQVLKLFRTNVTDGGAAVEVSANVTTSGTNWQFQDSGLVAGKQYRYEARIMDGSTLVDASNTYTINEAVSTLPTNAGVTLAVRITTDIDNNTWVGPNEVGSATTFTSRATFGSAVKAGDLLTFTASNGSTALSSQSVTLTSTDISQGYVDVTFTKPSDGVTQTVSVTYTDSMGNAATDAAPTDSATLDTTAPTIALARTDSNGTVVSGINTLKTGENGTLTLTLSEAPASGTLTAADLISSAGGTIGTVTATADPKVFTVQYTPPVNGQGTDVITVAASVFNDAAGNLNQDTYLNPAPSGQTYQANNQVSIAYDTAAPTQTVTLSSMTKDSGLSGTSPNSNWTTGDSSAGRLVSGFISSPLGAGEVVNVLRDGTLLGTATVAPNGTTWAFTDTTAYAGGNNTAATPSAGWTYTARVVDAVSNTGTLTTTQVYLDTTSAATPAITSVTTIESGTAVTRTTSGLTNSLLSSSLTVVAGTSTGANGNIVKVYDLSSNLYLGSATVNNGSWSLSGINGDYLTASGFNLKAVEFNAYGKQGGLSNAFTLSASNTPSGSPIADNSTAYSVYNTNAYSTWGQADSAGTIVNNFSWRISPWGPVNFGANADVFNLPGMQMFFSAPVSSFKSSFASANSGGYQIIGAGGVVMATVQPSALSAGTQTITNQYGTLNIEVFDTNDNGSTASKAGAYLTWTSTSGNPVLMLKDLGNSGDNAMVSVYNTTAANDGNVQPGTIDIGTSNTDTLSFSATNNTIDAKEGADTISAGSNISTILAAGGFISGGAGIDTLRLAAGTTLNLAALTNNQTVTPLQELEIIQMQGSSSVLSMTANNVLSLGGSNASTMSSYNFASVTNPQGGGTSSTGKVQMVVLGNTGDVLNLQALANDGITGTGVNAGIFGNSNLAGSWSYKGDVVLGGVTYKVYDHSTTQAQVLAKVDVTVNTLTPIAITSIVDNATSSADTGVSATDFVTSDTTLTYKGTMPVLASGEKVRVKILDSSNAVVYEGDATLNGTNWTFDRTTTALAAGNYTIQAQIVDSNNNPVASYGALGTATGPLKIDIGTPTIAVTASGSGNTRTVTFTLSEASTTFDATDVDMTNGQLSNFAVDTTSGTAASGYTRYTATFTATSGFSGTATVGVLNNKFSDIAGNTNQDTYAASPTSPVVNDGNNQVSFVVDGVPPTVAISSNQLYLNSTTNSATITFTFSEAVVQGSATNQFDLSDVVFSGGTLTALTPVTGTGDVTNGYTQYTATFTAATNSTADGFVGIQNGKFADATGNLNKDTYVAGVTSAVQESDNALTMPVNTTGTIQASTIQGGTNHYQAGTYVSGVGDVNGDGLEDFVVNTRSGGNDVNPSKSYVVFGAPALNISGINLTSLETAGNGQGFVINHLYNYIQSQVLTVSGNQDYNGDGLMDMVVNDGRNVSYVVLGKTNTSPVNMSSFQTSDGFTITAPYNSNVGTIGDFNGDGHVDTLLGLWNGSNWANSYILFGDGTTTNKTFNAIGNTNSNGIYVTTDRDIYTNAPPVVVGDFNGDGYSDFATTQISGGAFKSNVVFGGPVSVTTLTSSPNLNSVGFSVTYGGGGTTYYSAGTKSGDINGDGLDDLIYSRGTTGQFAVVFGKTTTSGVDLNSLGTNGFKITYNNTDFGTGNGGIDMVGDFNGDGLSDMLVIIRDSLNSYNGGAWLVYGRTAASDINLASLNATDGFKIGQGVNDGDTAATAPSSFNNQYGYWAAAAGDLNGDGFADLLISDYTNNAAPGSFNTGAVYVVYGGQFPTGSPTVFSAAAGDKLGTAGNDTLAGTSGNNQILGGQGNDTISGNGGADVLYGGSGNDTMVLNASNVTAFAATSSSQSIMRVDGGTGLDVLRLDGSGITLDLTAITHADLRSVEHFDITGSGNNTLRLSMRDVFDLGSNNSFDVNNAATDTRVQLMITGDAGDAVQLTDLGSWTAGSTYSYGGETYRIYNAGNLQLLIDTAIVPTT